MFLLKNPPLLSRQMSVILHEGQFSVCLQETGLQPIGRLYDPLENLPSRAGRALALARLQVHDLIASMLSGHIVCLAMSTAMTQYESIVSDNSFSRA